MKTLLIRILDTFLVLPRHLFHQRLRFRNIMDSVHVAEMDSQSVELYPEKLAFQCNETLSFCVKTVSVINKIEISKILAPHKYSIQYSDSIGKQDVINLPDPAVNGCGWKPNYSISPSQWKADAGYYRIKITGEVQETLSTFLVSKQTNSPVAVFAPVTTWVAYNPYGGKSLYKNFLDNHQVNSVSTLRPNTAVQYKEQLSIHDINIEAHIFNWFNKEYGADLFTDYDLEKDADFFSSYKIIVIPYHMEYTSRAMMNTLTQLRAKGKSIIFMGANQCYWKIQWHKKYTTLECRKDYSTFNFPWDLGGLWRHQLQNEALLQGVAFDDRGMTTYAPYAVTDSDHWLYSGMRVKQGDLFGQKGINALPICGDETDKRNPFTPAGFECIAKGLNPANSGELLVWPDPNVKWDSQGGGEMVVLSGDDQGILSTGSIQSGSGLDTDRIFTGIVKNFMDRYLK